MQREKYPAGVTTGIEINIGLLYFLSINIRGLQVRRLKQGRFGRTGLRQEIAGGGSRRRHNKIGPHGTDFFPGKKIGLRGRRRRRGRAEGETRRPHPPGGAPGQKEIHGARLNGYPSTRGSRRIISLKNKNIKNDLLSRAARPAAQGLTPRQEGRITRPRPE
jgi:hypothetical protein